MKKNTFSIWTDGSVHQPSIPGTPNLRSGGCHFVVLQGDTIYKEGSGQGNVTGINVMELRAVYLALKTLPQGAKAVVYTDSRNTIGWLTGTMQTSATSIAKEVADIRDLVDKRAIRLSFEKVAAHTGVKWNERCDKGAKQAMKDQIIRNDWVDGVGTAPAAPEPEAAPAISGNPPLISGKAASLHVTSRGSAYVATLSDVVLSEVAPGDNTDAVFAGILAGVQSTPEGTTLTISTSSLNHAKWLSGEYRAKVPRVATWVATIREAAAKRRLTLVITT